MSDILKGLEPKWVWDLFGEITKIPHGSKNEAALAAYLKKFAEEHGLRALQDEAGTLVISAKATPGFENAPAVVLQGHIDMVCEKNSSVDFDFEKDALRLVRDGDWIKADGTTLGADNGIGVAAGLAAALDPAAVHGPLEILLTIDEETGLTGAMKLDPKNIKGRILLNLDSEETDIVYIGCAGGSGVDAKLPIKWVDPPQGCVGAKLAVSGLRGGHSGCDIHENRGNAVKLLARTLLALAPLDAALADFHSGDKHNAIPREGTAVAAIPAAKFDEAARIVSRKLAEFRVEFPADKDLAMTLTKIEEPNGVMSKDTHEAAVNLLLAYPNGVLAMSRDLPGLVETSNSLASAHVKGDVLLAHNSPRSSNASAIRGALDQILACGALAGAQNIEEDAYPGWQPNPGSKILRLVEDVHEKLFTKKPDVRAIHAGLECGIIGEKFGGMDMVSFGPDIRNPHSPDERVNVPSVAKFWKLLLGVLEAVARGGY